MLCGVGVCVNVFDRDLRISDTLAGISACYSIPRTASRVPSTQINATMSKIKARIATENNFEDVLWSRVIERVPRFGDLLSYTRSLGLPSATVLEEEKRGSEPMRSTGHRSLGWGRLWGSG